MVDTRLKGYIKKTEEETGCKVSKVFNLNVTSYLFVLVGIDGKQVMDGLYRINKRNGKRSGYMPITDIENFKKVSKQRPLYTA